MKNVTNNFMLFSKKAYKYVLKIVKHEPFSMFLKLLPLTHVSSHFHEFCNSFYVHFSARSHNNWDGVFGRAPLDGNFGTILTHPTPSSTQGRVLHPDQPRQVPSTYMQCFGSGSGFFRRSGFRVFSPIRIRVLKVRIRPLILMGSK